MTARFHMTRVSHPATLGDGAPWRQINDNFQQLQALLERAIVSGDLIADGTVTEAMLATATKTLVGDVTGTIGASGATTVADVSILTTRGDLLYRNATVATRLSVGANDTLLTSDGTDPGWETLTSLMDSAIGSTRGSVLYRGASGWAILTPGTNGDVLTSQGAGADPTYTTPATGTPPTDFDLLTDGVSSLIFAGGDVVWIT